MTSNKSTENTREIALLTLIEINEKNGKAHIVLREVLDKYQYLSKVDRAFITRLVDGTVEYKLQLDYIIDLFSKTKVKKMKPFIRNLLRMSVYQLKYMDSVPDSAVCNEAVKLAKRHKFGSLSGFVNGVLRNVARNIENISFDSLSVKYSMPDWIVEHFEKEYGTKKTEQILAAFMQKPILSIRTDTSRISPKDLKEMLLAEGVIVKEITDVLPNDLNTDELGVFAISDVDYLGGLESFKKGLFYVQDASSMMAVVTAGIKKDDYVIDVCAAPGGKATHAAQLLDGSGMVEARDLTEYKISLIEENIKRQNLKNIKAVLWDATVLDESARDKADVLICDLPCSGLGVLGRKKDIRYNITPESIDSLVALQRQILDTVQTYVKSGGVLLYSTCTIDKAENEDNVKWFLEKYPQFHLDKNCFDGAGMKQLFPLECGNDGFFIARMIKK